MPTEITDWNDLDNVRNGLSDDYVLVNDLDSSTVGYDGIGDDFEPIGYISGDGFTSEFMGSFDGGGHSISDLVVDYSGTGAADVGLFASTGDAALIENVIVAGDVTGGDGSDQTGRSIAGGLIGHHEGGLIRHCASFVDVTATGDFVGSFAGSNLGGDIEDSYSIGSATGDSDVGGFVGRVEGTIERCYSAGLVEGNSSVGGFAGNSFGTINDCYWDTERSQQSSSDGGTGLTSAEMRGESASTNMNGLNFESIWETID